MPPSGDATATLTLGTEVTKLSAFNVEGYREGRSKALQQKRTNDNIMDVVSADSIGNLPDRNVAEAVARVPGVNMSLEQGEGRYVSIRGVEPNLNQVMLDGAARAVPLDALGTGQISQIEVIKSATPDMDVNALGGTLNLKTASPFDRNSRLLAGSLSGNRNETTAKTDVEARVSFSDTFGPDRKWGVAAGARYEKRHYSNEWLQSGWNLRADCRSAAMVDSVMRRFLDGIRGDPVVPESEFEKCRKNTAPVIVGFQRRVAALEVGSQDLRRKLADAGLGEVRLQRFKFVPDGSLKMALQMNGLQNSSALQTKPQARSRLVQSARSARSGSSPGLRIRARCALGDCRRTWQGRCRRRRSRDSIPRKTASAARSGPSVRTPWDDRSRDRTSARGVQWCSARASEV